MTITIPEWVLWLLGGALGLVVLALAALGILFIIAFPRGGFWR